MEIRKVDNQEVRDLLLVPTNIKMRSFDNSGFAFNVFKFLGNLIYSDPTEVVNKISRYREGVRHITHVSEMKSDEYLVALRKSAFESMVIKQVGSRWFCKSGDYFEIIGETPQYILEESMVWFINGQHYIGKVELFAVKDTLHDLSCRYKYDLERYSFFILTTTDISVKGKSELKDGTQVIFSKELAVYMARSKKCGLIEVASYEEDCLSISEMLVDSKTGIFSQEGELNISEDLVYVMWFDREYRVNDVTIHKCYIL